MPAASGRSTSRRRSARISAGTCARRARAANDLCGLSGAFFPFARTKAERPASGDPRLSLEERYKDHAGFVRAVKRATERLVRERFLLEEDARTQIRMAEESQILKADN